MNRIYSMLASPFALKKEYANSMVPQLLALLDNSKVKPSLEELKEIKRLNMEKLATMYGFKVKAGGDSIAFHSSMQVEEVPAGSIALIKVEGFISAQGDWCMKGLNDYTEELQAAGRSQNIKGVILQVNSFGGSIEGVQNFSDFVGKFETKYGKPLAAFIDSAADSAGYYILAQAPRIFVNGRQSECGSIGTMVSAYDYKGMLEAEGIIERIAYASKSNNKNKAGTDFLNGENAEIVKYLDKYNELFLATVRKGRPMLNTNITVTTNDANGNAMTFPEVLSGTVYVGTEILTMGLADEITDLDGVVRYIETKAMQMGWGNGSSTIVETDDNQDSMDDMMDDMSSSNYSYNQQKLNTKMFKKLSNETLQSQLKSCESDLNVIAGTKGVASNEYQSKANLIALMEMESENRKLQESSDKYKDDFKTAQAGLTEKDATIEALKTDLQAAKTAVNPIDAQKVTDLEAEKVAFTAEKETFLVQVQKLEAEKLALSVEKETLSSELNAHKDFVSKQGLEMPTLVAAVVVTESSQPEGHQKAVEPMSSEQQVDAALRARFMKQSASKKQA